MCCPGRLFAMVCIWMVLSILGHAHSSVGVVISEKNYADKTSISGSDADEAFASGSEMEKG